MVDAQRTMGGGVLSFAIEHTGDIYHRMAEYYDEPLGRKGVGGLDKVKKVLRTLENEYGFEKENEENMKSNARAQGISLEDYKAKVNQALYKYADEHKKLPAINLPMKLARNASIALGNQDLRVQPDYSTH